MVFTPKSILRLKAAVSLIADVTSGTFQPVLADPSPGAAIRQVVLCTGKVYYDLLAGRTKRKAADTALVRVEQLYPLPVDEIVESIADYPDAEVVWCQEEPANMGAWPYIALNLPEHLDGRELRRISRTASASPAAGSHNRHDAEQLAILDEVFG